MKRVNYHLEESQIERLRKQSLATGVPVAHMIRLAVEHFLKAAESGAAKPKTRKPRPTAPPTP